MADEPLTITAAAPLIRSGELTPSELLEQCLRRIDVYEPKVQAWVYLDRERARRDAAHLTDAVKKGDYRGPLHGIPIGVKDIIDVFDMPTGCGSKLWANSYARRDATVVERLRAAGALILGKTVTTPYAFTDPPKTRNPWNLDRTPGGSSSGSAAAVACGMCLGAIATQTGGSTTRPASYCGVCSLKPMWGGVSVDGVLPLAPSLDHVGVMANCVRDLAILYQEIGIDDSGFCGGLNPDYLRILEEGFEICHFAFVGGLFHDLADESMRSLLTTLREPILGMTQKPSGRYDLRLPDRFGDVLSRHYRMMALGAASVHAARLSRCPDDYPKNITRLIQDGIGFRGHDSIEDQMAHLDFHDHSCDSISRAGLLVTPAATGVAPTLDTTGSPAMNAPWSYSRLPTLSVPAGWAENLPLGIQITARNYSESELFYGASFIEKRLAETGQFIHRLPPVPA